MIAGDAYVVRPTIPASYVRDLLAHTRLDARRMLAAAGLPVDAPRVRKFRASVEQFERLYTLACVACNDEMFGFLADRVPRGMYAIAMRLFAGGRDMAEFVESAARLYAVFDRGHRYWSVAREGGRAIVRLHCRTAAQAASIFFVHAMLITPWRSAEWLVASPIPLRAVRIDPRFARFAGETSTLFGRDAELVPGAAEIAFEASWLTTRIARSPDDADAFARGSLRSMLVPAPGDTLAGAIRGALARSIHDDLPTVARSLGMSRATLARKLAAAGLAFQQIKDDVRRDLAIALLATTSVADVAERLGFSEPSAFARAFKAWTGVPPGHYRTR